jgi:hypothetical protein
LLPEAGTPAEAFMASVWIVPRDGARDRKYLVYYTDPVTGKNKYHKAFPRKKDAQDEEHRLRAYIDTGRNDGLRPARERARPIPSGKWADCSLPTGKPGWSKAR